MTATSLTMIDDEAYGAVRAICVKRARGLGLGPEDAEYVAQDVVLSLMTQDEAPLNPAAWAMTVTKYRVMDRFRAQQRRPDQRKLEEFAGSRRELDHFVGRQFSSSELAISGMAMKQIAEILSTVVSAREIEVLRMVAEGATYREIAEAQGYANADTVKATVHKLRKRALTVADELGELRHHPRVY